MGSTKRFEFRWRLSLFVEPTAQTHIWICYYCMLEENIGIYGRLPFVWANLHVVCVIANG